MTLTDDQVRDLCQRRDAGVIAHAATHDPQARRLTRDATPSELARLVDDGITARHQLIEANLGLVGFVVNRYQGGIDRDDLFQEGALALAKAADRYDPHQGTFSTFAVATIRGAVNKALDTRAGRLHLNPTQARARVLVLTETQRRQAAGLPTSPADIGAALGRTEDWVRDALTYQPHTSLNGADGPIDVTDPRSQKPFEAVTNLDITTYLDMLPARERTALTLAYGLDGDQPKAHQEIADELRCSPSTASRLVGSAREHLRTLIVRFDAEPPAPSPSPKPPTSSRPEHRSPPATRPAMATRR